MFEFKFFGKPIINRFSQQNAYRITINDYYDEKFLIHSVYPASLIDRLSLVGDISLLEEKPLTSYPKMNKTMPNIKYKHEIKTIQKTGTILDLDAFVPSLKMINRTNIYFNIQLLTDASELHSKRLFLYSLIDGEETSVEYPNPIVQTGVRFNLKIVATETHLNLIVNDAIDYFKFSHQLPPWALNWITIDGYITDVKFRKIEYKLPQNIIQVNHANPLLDGSYINIYGIISEPFNNISINLFYGALEYNEIGE
uniref:Galectin domain-containing protein n=1 Tax=Meloidogyne hapla TaxID=6305 RepID=A0A1I8B441_MELHA